MWMIYAHGANGNAVASKTRHTSRSLAEQEAQKWRTREWQKKWGLSGVRHVRVLDIAIGRFYCLDCKDPKYPSGKESLTWVKQWSARVKFGWAIVGIRADTNQEEMFSRAATYGTRKLAEKRIPHVKQDTIRFRHRKTRECPQCAGRMAVIEDSEQRLRMRCGTCSYTLDRVSYKRFKVVRGKVNLTNDRFCESEWIRRKHEWVPTGNLVQTAEETGLLEIYKRGEDGLRLR